MDIDNERYKQFLLISGGIGITPLQSICNDLIIQRFRGRDLKHIKFVWAVRDRRMARSVADYKDNFWNKKIDKDQMNGLFNTDVFAVHQLKDIIDSEFFVTRYVTIIDRFEKALCLVK